MRIVNLSLLNTDWYIAQLKYQSSNEAPPVPISISDEVFMGEKSATMPFQSQTLLLPVDKTAFLTHYPEAHRFTPESLADTLRWSVPARGGDKNSYLLKQDYMTLDIVLTNLRQGWKRPICFANTLPSFSYMGLQDYLYMRGTVYELLPLKPQGAPKGSIYNAAIQDSLTYDLLTRVYRYRNLNRPDLFYDSNTQRMIANYRSIFYRVVDQYIQQADTLRNDTLKAQALREKGQNLLRFLQKTISQESCPLEPYQIAQEAGLWLGLGNRDEAFKLYRQALQMLKEEVDYASYMRQPLDDMMQYGIEMVARGAVGLGDSLFVREAIDLYEKSRSVRLAPNR
ncbi:MAG: hypothetical protein D6750_08565 [Bacteroidetes bacterium]|nr:MAG: hypothetical protein D6750_08565 [Bacteroidota bacterium]